MRITLVCCVWSIMCLSLRAQDDLTLYSNAVVRASMPNTPNRVYADLVDVRTDNTNLVWWDNGGTNMVLVASFMSAGTATGNYYPGHWQTVWNGRESWVTTVPELQDFCCDYTNAQPDADIALRCKKLLGLNPSWGQSYVVEYYINPAYLARPAPDIEITDREAELDFSFTNNVVFPISINTNYYNWYTNRQATVYQAAFGNLGGDDVPWGRLGYTWDWAYTNENASATNSIVGLSEFIIPAQYSSASIPIYVVTVTTVTNYGLLTDLPPVVETIAPTGSLVGGFTAMWDSATRATEYILDVARDSEFTDFVTGFSNRMVVAATQCSVTSLTAGDYYYRVSAVNPKGTGTVSNARRVDVTASRRSPLSWLLLLFD